MSWDFKLENGDITLSSSGTPVAVRNSDKLRQDILKLLFTPQGENLLHPWYGTPLLNSAVGNNYDYDILVSEVHSAIEYGINNLITLQQLQQKNNQFLTPKEQILKIKDIGVDLDEQDKRRLIIFLDISSKSGETVSESITVTL